MKLTLACLLILTLIAGAACAQTIEAPPEAGLTPAVQPEETPLAGTAEEDIEAARQAVFTYFEALNNYDLEAALACMEESWGKEKEPGLTGEISQMETWSVTLEATEEADVAVTDDEKVEIYVKIDVSTLGQPDRHAVYQLMEIEEEWKICYSEDVE